MNIIAKKSTKGKFKRLKKRKPIRPATCEVGYGNRDMAEYAVEFFSQNGIKAKIISEKWYEVKMKVYADKQTANPIALEAFKLFYGLP